MAKKLTDKVISSFVKKGDERMKPYRKIRTELMKSYVGPYYRNQNASEKLAWHQPLNIIYQTCQIYIAHLAGRNPKSLITPATLELVPYAENFGLALDHLYDEIDLVKTMRRVILDAMFGFGVCHTGLTTGRPVNELNDGNGYLHDLGQPFVDRISIDDFIIDPWCRKLEESLFMGHKFRLPISYAKECGLYKPDDITEMAKYNSYRYGTGAIERAEDLSKESTIGGTDEEEIFIELINIWLPSMNKIKTFGSAGPEGIYEKSIRDVDYIGPERGPYEILGFSEVPDNPIPLAPIPIIFDLHVLLNKLAVKSGQQADRQKTLTLADKTAEEDAQQISDASDGDVLLVDSVDRVKELSYGGVNQELYKHMDWVKNYISQISGNTNLLGGNEAQSRTLGQDQMLFSNANVGVDDMKFIVHSFTKHVVKKLGWYLWSDEFIEVPLIKRIEGFEIESKFSAEEMEGDWLDYNLDIEPGSMNPDSPNERYRRIQEWLQSVILPLNETAVAQGKTINVDNLAKISAKYLNIPEVDAQQIFTDLPQQPQEQLVPKGISPRAGGNTNVSVTGQRSPGGQNTAQVSPEAKKSE
jgi:hypothetical protein